MMGTSSAWSKDNRPSFTHIYICTKTFLFLGDRYGSFYRNCKVKSRKNALGKIGSKIQSKKFKITNPLNASTGVIVYSAIIINIYLLLNDSLIPDDFGNIEYITAIFILGIFCTAIATIIYFQILQTSGATFISIMNYLIPIWAIIFGVIFFKEDAAWHYFIGLVIIIAGIQISQKNGKELKSKPTKI